MILLLILANKIRMSFIKEMNAHEKTKDYRGNTLHLIIKLHNTERVWIKLIKQILHK